MGSNGEMMTGRILRVLLPRGFGFIRGDDGREYFLHAKELPDGLWDGDVLHDGVRVQFIPRETEHGWRALCATIID